MLLQDLLLLSVTREQVLKQSFNELLESPGLTFIVGKTSFFWLFFCQQMCYRFCIEDGASRWPVMVI